MALEVKDYLQRWEFLKDQRLILDDIAKDVSEYISPHLGRFLEDESDPDQAHKRRGDKILESTAQTAHNIASNGMHSGLTPPSRDWFALSFIDEAMNKYSSAKQWLEDVKSACMNALRRSNFYTAIHANYQEILSFANSCIRVDVHPAIGLRFKAHTFGEYWFSAGSTGKIDTVYRTDAMTVRQIREMFGESKLTEDMRNCVANNKPYTSFDILHVVQPRKDRDPTLEDSRNKPWESVYIALSGGSRGTPGAILNESGFDLFPYAVGRWSVTGTNHYGFDSPGVRALPDVKMLQDIEKSTLIAIHREIDPPVIAPSSMSTVPIRKNPGGITYADTMDHSGLRPLYELRFNIMAAEQKAAEIRQRVQKIFSNDLFMMISATEAQKSNVTATQIVEMQREKLLQLGPFIERQEDEVLDPIIESVVRYVLENPEKHGLSPPPPEVAGQDYRIEYVSLLAMAQKQTAVKFIDDAVIWASQVAQVFPEVLDNIDIDGAYRERCELMGTPASVNADPKVVMAKRDQRQQMLQQQQAMQAAMSGTQAIKDLGSAKMNPEDPNVLSELFGKGVTEGGPVQ